MDLLERYNFSNIHVQILFLGMVCRRRRGLGLHNPSRMIRRGMHLKHKQSVYDGVGSTGGQLLLAL